MPFQRQDFLHIGPPLECIKVAGRLGQVNFYQCPFSSLRENMARRSADFEASSSDEDEAVVFDRETYLKKLNAYKRKARKDIRKMCHLEFKKTCDELLSTAHHIMQDYVQFGEVSQSVIYFSLSYRCKYISFLRSWQQRSNSCP